MSVIIPDDASSTPSQITIGVQISTFQRPSGLQRCLEGLAEQSLRPDDVMVICREDDAATHAWFVDVWPQLDIARQDNALPIRIINVVTPGLVNSRNAGLNACRTDILAIIDDDVVPPREWLAHIHKHFKDDPTLGALGGRDHVHNGECFDERQKGPVGLLQWFGRAIGNHHLGFGPARPVHFLKGANMIYRAKAIDGLRFDTRLRGRFVQPHDDLSFSLKVMKRGWKLVYDPDVLVFHYAGRPDQRAYSSIARQVKLDEVRDSSFNMVIALWEVLPIWRRVAFIFWSFLIGTGVEPGLVQAVRYTPQLGLVSWRRLLAAQQGKFQALVYLFRAIGTSEQTHLPQSDRHLGPVRDRKTGTL